MPAPRPASRPSPTRWSSSAPGRDGSTHASPATSSPGLPLSRDRWSFSAALAHAVACGPRAGSPDPGTRHAGRPHTWFVQGVAALGGRANGNFISNAGFVITDSSVVVVDALGSPALARSLLAEIRRITPKPVSHVIVTHYHADHIYGLQTMRAAGAVIVANRRAQRVPQLRHRATAAEGEPRGTRAVDRRAHGTRPRRPLDRRRGDARDRRHALRHPRGRAGAHAGGRGHPRAVRARAVRRRPGVPQPRFPTSARPTAGAGWPRWRRCLPTTPP